MYMGLSKILHISGHKGFLSDTTLTASPICIKSNRRELRRGSSGRNKKEGKFLNQNLIGIPCQCK